MTRLTLPVLIGAAFLVLIVFSVAATAQRGRALEQERREQSRDESRSAPAADSDAPSLTSPADLTTPTRPPRPRGFALAKVAAGETVALRSRPRGRVVTRVGAKTEFGSARVLAVAERNGPWLGVTSEALPNGELGWVDSRAEELELSRTRVSLRADLSERRLQLRVGGRVVKRISVSVGRAGSSTPTGRFAVTDKLSGSNYGSYYGCCILALSGRQPNLPPGWSGGNRLAIHGTDAPSTIGAAASAGCLRAADTPLRVLMRRVPVGTPVFVRR